MWEKDYAAEFFGNFECHVICTNRSNVYWYNNKGEFQTDSPDILFHAADEACKNAEIVGRYTKFKHVFRQYACHKQYFHEYTQTRNIRIIPLGYMVGMIPTSSYEHAQDIILHINNTRKYTWSFIGTIKSDRLKAITAFIDLEPNFHGQFSKLQIANVYRDSDFVISPRGNVNLDCFRHYEASINGAIPVVVGSTEEIDDTFGHFLSKPPWLFANSWEEANIAVRLLMSDPDRLVRRRYSVVKWWISEIRNFTKTYT